MSREMRPKSFGSFEKRAPGHQLEYPARSSFAHVSAIQFSGDKEARFFINSVCNSILLYLSGTTCVVVG